MTIRTFIAIFSTTLIFGISAFAGNRNPEPSAGLTTAIAKLDREAFSDADGAFFLSGMVQKEYGTAEDELRWAVEQKVSWGDIVALAYIQATTGKSFAEMSRENARQDFWSYAENAGMSCEKMARALEGFLKRAERERNSRIFDRLRVSRRVHPLPDLGSGFGLFQEALDFRHIDLPRTTKIHEGAGVLAKGEK